MLQTEAKTKEPEINFVNFSCSRIVILGNNLVVGKDSMFGSGNPAKAIPESEGHVWTTKIL